MDPILLDFIQKAKAASETDEEIRGSLASAGWEAQEIDQAFASFLTSANNLPISVPSSSPNNTMKVSMGKFIVPLVVVIVLLVVGITAGYVMLKSPPQAPSSVTNTPKTKPNETPKVKPSVISVSPRIISPTTMRGQPITVNKTRNILVYTETPQSGKPPVLVFYDVVKRQKLPPDPVIEDDKNYMIQLGPWSPNGQYLPILARTGPASAESNTNIYLFDSKAAQSREIYGAPSSVESPAWSSTSFSSSSSWIDNTKLVLDTTRDLQGALTALTYITTEGTIITEQRSGGIKYINNQLEYGVNLGGPARIVSSIKVGSRELDFVPEGEIVGMVDDMLVVLERPQPVSMEELFDPTKNSEISKQIEEWNKEGLSEEEQSNRMWELMEPKGNTTLKFYNLVDGSTKKEINLTDGTWQVQSILVHPSEKSLVAHQTDKLFRPSQNRFILITPSSESSIRILYEENVAGNHNSLDSSMLMYQGTSFFLSTDGNLIIGMRDSQTENPNDKTIYMRNIANAQEDIVCPSNCYDMRVHYPYHLETRY